MVRLVPHQSPVPPGRSGFDCSCDWITTLSSACLIEFWAIDMISIARFAGRDLPQLLAELAQHLFIALTDGDQFTKPAGQFLQVLDEASQLLFNIGFARLQQVAAALCAALLLEDLAVGDSTCALKATLASSSSS